MIIKGFRMLHHTPYVNNHNRTNVCESELELRTLGEKYQHTMRPTMKTKHCGERGDQQEIDTHEEEF